MAGAANCAMQSEATKVEAEAALTSLLKRLLGATAKCYQDKVVCYQRYQKHRRNVFLIVKCGNKYD
jgi:hypothetical protein